MLIPPTLARIHARDQAPRPFPADRLAAPPGISPTLTRCPECDAPVARASGCLACLVCGWGKCG